MNWNMLLLAQVTAASASPDLSKVNPGNYSTLINYSMIFMLFPAFMMAAIIGYIILNSPMGAPVFRWLADSAFKKKNYLRAAERYAKLHELQVLMEGNIYARKAALSMELGGNLREAQRWYEKADDWVKVGQLLLESGKREQAIEIFKLHDLPARLAHCYEQSDDFLNAGEVYEFQLNNLRKAEQHYKRAANSQDRETFLHAKLRLARVYHQLERPEDAQSAYAEASREIESSVQYQEFPDLLALQAEVRSLIHQDTKRD